MQEPVFALVDCNNFYCSCERAFQPHLAKLPVVVLSNNDGCVVARSSEVKALGVKMGAPYFQIKSLVAQHDIQVFSSNYALYADMSNRVMRMLKDYAFRIEIYSIDEAFLDLTGLDTDLTQYGKEIQRDLFKGLGLPVCVGIGPTKTLAKVANYYAKKYAQYGGCFNLCDKQTRLDTLQQVPVSEVWGVGAQTAKKLRALDILTALELSLAPLPMLKAHFGVVVERIALELSGVSCLSLEEIVPAKKQIISSRSFGVDIQDLEALKEAVANYTATAVRKLRMQNSVANTLTVFLSTNPHKDTAQYHPCYTLSLPNASADTRDFLHFSMQIVKHLYKKGYSYKKAGVMLGDIHSAHFQQASLFDDNAQNEESKHLMSTMDKIQKRFGKESLFFAQQGTTYSELKQRWLMKQSKKSKPFTTQWSSIPIVRAK